MVNVKTIETIINKILYSKDIIIKHSDFETRIDKTIKNITSDKNERDLLKDEIWSFHKKIKSLNSEYHRKYHKDFPFEVLRCQSTSGKSYENFTNKEKEEVDLPLEAKYDGCTEGLLFAIHNHPNDEVNIKNNNEDYVEKLGFTCFQSPSDIDNLLMFNTKYNITLGNDGIMIIKNEHHNNPKNYLNPNDYSGTFEEKIEAMTNVREKSEFNNEISKKYTELYTDLNDDYDDIVGHYDIHNSLDKVSYGSEDYELLDDGFFSKYISDNIVDNTINFDETINGIGLYYIQK